MPDTTKEVQTFTMRIEAMALGGKILRTANKILSYKCFDNYLISPPADFNNKVFYLETQGVAEISYDFSKFISSHSYCNISSYKLDNNNNPAVLTTPPQVRLNPTCVTAYGLLCR